MQWWDDLWLNEGFASWAENWAADLLYSDFAMWPQFTTGHLASALRLDALKSSHPIQVPIQHAEEVEQVFDAISYCKGGSVVRMIRAVLGMNHFRNGLANYMKKFAYSNTETLDLWQAWEEVSSMPVTEMMASWTEQMGFPLVRVLKENWTAESVTFELDQQWFLSDGSDLDAEGAAKVWTIPILTCTESGQQADMTLMREKTGTVTIPTTSWVKLNAGQEVPMRVLPTEEMLRRLALGIQDKSLGEIDRASLLSDAYALVKAKHMRPESLIRLLGNYKNEDSYIVWESLASVLCGLKAILSEDANISTFFSKLARSIILNLMLMVGWTSGKSDGHLTTLLRGVMVGLCCEFAHDDPTVVAEASARFKAFQENHNDVLSLPSDMRSSVFKIYLNNGGVKEYDEVKAYFFQASDSAEKKHVLNSLGATPDKKQKKAIMEWTTSGELKLQDFFYPMGSVSRSCKEGREIAWQYMKDNFVKIQKMLGTSSTSLMDACIVMCAGAFCSNEKADEINAFFMENPVPQSTRKIEQTIESIRANASMLQIVQSSELSTADFWSSL
jgi:puromycin-sensitive aminopeptidase